TCPRARRVSACQEQSDPSWSVTVTGVLRLHDTALGRVVDLETREPGRFSMYVCGPTVYDVPHIGHGRALLVYAVLRRYLEWRAASRTRPPTASTSRSTRWRTTACSPASRSTRCAPGPASSWGRASARPSTSCCGRRPGRVSPRGRRPGARVAQDGTPSAW